MAEIKTSAFDEKSQLWLQPFSEIINYMLPMEYIYGEWNWLICKSKAKRCDPESLTFDPSEIEIGSRIEGLCIPQYYMGSAEDTFPSSFLKENNKWESDSDTMDVKDCFVVNEETNQVIPIFTVEHTSDDPRYVHLRFTDEWKQYTPWFKNAIFVNHSYALPGKRIRDAKLHLFNERHSELQPQFAYEMHGPVWKLEGNGLLGFEEDQTGVFKYPLAWPEPAMEWLVRPRTNGWPSPELLQDILESGCHLAPVGRGKRQDEPMDFFKYNKNPEMASNSCRKTDQENPNDHDIMDETEWRLSFSVAENKLGQSVSPVQRHVLVLLKMIKKMYFPDLVSSYLLKNLLFWEIENQDPSFWREANSAKCLLLILDRLQKSLEEGHLPHYIIPQSNLLQNENPDKLAEEAAKIDDVRRNILPKIISLLKKCHSMTYHSQIYLNNIQDLDSLVAKVRDKSLAEQDVIALTSSVIALFAKKAKEVTKRIFKLARFGDSKESTKKLMMVAVYAYQSVLARSLCKIWYLNPDKSSDEKSNEKEFESFVRQETTDLSTGDEYMPLALAFYAEQQEGRDMSFLVPQTSVMERTKEIHREEALDQFQEVQAPVMEILKWLGRSDLINIQKKLSKDLDGQLENLTMETLEMEINKEIQKLFIERCPSTQVPERENNHEN